MSDWMFQILTGLAGAAGLMFVLWLVQLRTRNAGIVDLGWTLGIGAFVIALAVNSPGEASRRIIIAAITTTWSLRLGWHLLQRISSEPEDGRYTNLREWAGKNEQPALLIFFLLQATWVVLFSLPQMCGLYNMQPLSWTDFVAILVFAVSIGGESLADAQLARFRRDPANRGEVCQVGLWRYSRHPNYFFEWLHWFAYPLLAIGTGWLAIWTLLGPAVMLLFLLKITGIPPTELRAVQSRGDKYRAYQRSTSAFFPWFPKEVST
jgi:steroid 5-alpha reductase family enzyme